VSTRKDARSCLAADLQVGRWHVQPALNQIRDGRTVRHLEPQVINLLVFLAANSGRVVSKDQIIDRVWEGRFIAEATLTRSIADLRRALGDNTQQPEYIETIAMGTAQKNEAEAASRSFTVPTSNAASTL
jgi:DNA-binding winged helix-turn-helix (wHTH) protein